MLDNKETQTFSPESFCGHCESFITLLIPYYDHFSVDIRGRKVEWNRRFAISNGPRKPFESKGQTITMCLMA